MNAKKSIAVVATTTAACQGGDSLLERLPDNLIGVILSKLEPEKLTTLCSVACVSRTLSSSVNQAISGLSSLDLSLCSPDYRTFDRIIARLRKIETITLDCLRLNDYSVTSFIGPDVKELILLKCPSLSHLLLVTIGVKCPNLRALTVEFSGVFDRPNMFENSFNYLLENCRHIESLHIKIRGDINEYGFVLPGLYHLLPKTMKVLKLQPASRDGIIDFLRNLRLSDFGGPFSSTSPGQTLTRLSLALDIVTDVLVIAIVNSLPLLVRLDLKDRPTSEPSFQEDLTNVGLQSLIRCRHLTSLSLIRSRQYIPAAFKRVTDMGMFLLSEGCKGLESVALGGFSRVSDAGFTSILNACLNLKKIEIQNAPLLTDLAFQDFSKVPRSLVEVKLGSCNYITSEAVNELAFSSMLEVLDLSGCKSVADPCLKTVSSLTSLTSLNLWGADVTDAGMAILGKGKTPISYLCLRGCKRVTDNGITHLFGGGGKIGKTLSYLDLGYMPRVSDKAILAIAEAAAGIRELCMRNCFHVTDASLKALALKKRSQDGSELLRRLDICNCIGLSVESLELLKKPFFPGLQWVGIGRTGLTSKGDDGLAEIREERPWLTICADGCEMGCEDGWPYHKFA